MKSLGLKTPPLTKVIVSDRTLLPSLIGPSRIEPAPSNLWRKNEAYKTILLQPFLYYRQVVTNPIVLFHERTHTILEGMYHRDSYTSNRHIQEGLADFLPSHHTGNPKLNLPMDIGSSRNLDTVPTLPLSTSYEPHNRGKLFSYTLWKLRERMGEEQMAALLKPFIDGLNQYYESFEKQHSYGEIEGYIEKMFRSKYEYFMAVLKKTLQEKGKIREADEFIGEITTELGLDIAVVDELAGSITKSDKNFYSTSTDKRTTPLLFYFLGTAAIATEIYLGYLGYRYFFGQKD